MDQLVTALVASASLLPYLLFGLALFVLGKFFFDWSTPRIDDEAELAERDNPAFGVLFAGYMLGLAFAIAGSFANLGPSPLENFLDIGVSGVAAILLLRLSMAIGTRLVLPGLDFSEEIVGHRNLGAGFAFAGLAAANGLVIGGLMSGTSRTFLDMFLDMGTYWLLGQALLLLAWLLFRAIASFDAVKAIAHEDNPAAGLSLGGFFVAVGIVLGASLRGAGSERLVEALISLAVGLVGLLFLAGANLLAGFLLHRRERLSEEIAGQRNLAAGAVSALSSVAVALLYAALLGSQLG